MHERLKSWKLKASVTATTPALASVSTIPSPPQPRPYPPSMLPAVTSMSSAYCTTNLAHRPSLSPEDSRAFVNSVLGAQLATSFKKHSQQLYEKERRREEKETAMRTKMNAWTASRTQSNIATHSVAELPPSTSVTTSTPIPSFEGLERGLASFGKTMSSALHLKESSVKKERVAGTGRR